MKKLLFLAIATIAITNLCNAQFSEFQRSDSSTSGFTFSSENNTMQIGGRVSGYYENRFLKTGYTNLSHNGWAVKDADLDLLGKTNNHFVYEFHISLVDIIAAAATQNTANPANPGFKAAYISYEGWKVHVKFGYDKLPFSQGSISDVYATPMWSHANLYGGDLFSRRDFGLTFNTRLLHNHINLYGGAYSGMGENFYEYGNDASGTFEYIGRIEYCFPGKMKYHPLDEENTQKPTFRIAANIRYEDKTQPTGQTIGVDAPGAYGLRIINGKRMVYGGDFIAKYKGFSYLFETDLMKLTPANATDPLFEGTSNAVNGGYIKAGGFVTGLNYNSDKLRSTFSVNYEDFKTDDLTVSEQSWLYFGYAYKVSGYNSVLKAEYYIPTKEATLTNPLKYSGQIRIGYQIVF